MLSLPYPQLRGRTRSGRSVGLVKHIPSKYFHQPRIDLPNRTIDIHSRALQRHVPGFHQLWRESGNTRFNPMNYIRPQLASYAQDDMYEKAVNWLFYRVSDAWYPHRAPAARSVAEYNPFQAAMETIDYYYYSRDYNEAEILINDTLEVFRCLSMLVRPGRFGDLSLQLFGDYFDVAMKLAPFISSSKIPQGDAIEMMFDLVEAVATASGDDKNVVFRMIQQFSTNETTELTRHCSRLVQKGDKFAQWLYNVLLGYI